jgi:hypothetical protein
VLRLMLLRVCVADGWLLVVVDGGGGEGVSLARCRCLWCHSVVVI